MINYRDNPDWVPEVRKICPDGVDCVYVLPLSLLPPLTLPSQPHPLDPAGNNAEQRPPPPPPLNSTTHNPPRHKLRRRRPHNPPPLPASNPPQRQRDLLRLRLRRAPTIKHPTPGPPKHQNHARGRDAVHRHPSGTGVLQRPAVQAPPRTDSAGAAQSVRAGRSETGARGSGRTEDQWETIAQDGVVPAVGLVRGRLIRLFMLFDGVGSIVAAFVSIWCRFRQRTVKPAQPVHVSVLEIPYSSCYFLGFRKPRNQNMPTSIHVSHTENRQPVCA